MWSELQRSRLKKQKLFASVVSIKTEFLATVLLSSLPHWTADNFDKIQQVETIMNSEMTLMIIFVSSLEVPGYKISLFGHKIIEEEKNYFKLKW